MLSRQNTTEAQVYTKIEYKQRREGTIHTIRDTLQFGGMKVEWEWQKS